MTATANVADLLANHARQHPQQLAVAMPTARGSDPADYDRTSFAELQQQSDRLAAGLCEMGVKPGMRIALAVPFNTDFILWVFALLKSGAVMVLVDPGMGRRQLLRCLEQVELDGLVGISKAQAVRSLLRRKFPKARFNVTVGRRWFWGGRTQRQLLARESSGFSPFAAAEDDPAAVIFTSGSTGPAKGVCYQHGNFSQQVEKIREHYQIESSDVDLPAFPLFGLFNAAMGVSSIIPRMDPSRPAEVDPEEIIRPIQQWQVTQSFGSPALWEAVGRRCHEKQIQLPSLRRVLSAGAPVPLRVLQRVSAAIAPDGEMFTPYGATEALPVASISASDRLALADRKAELGKGICVGNRFAGIQWKVIAIDDRPLEQFSQVEEVTDGQIGELIVKGPVVTRQYFELPAQTAVHKIHDGDGFWHRMGDVGFLDEQQRFWFCGRKSQRLQIGEETIYTVPAESILNDHPRVYRSALVGIGQRPDQRAVMVAELWPDKACQDEAEANEVARQLLQHVQAHPLTASVSDVLLHPSLPVDIRHNAKIFREKLAGWVASQLG